jgi:hypothetical protein
MPGMVMTLLNKIGAKKPHGSNGTPAPRLISPLSDFRHDQISTKIMDGTTNALMGRPNAKMIRDHSSSASKKRGCILTRLDKYDFQGSYERFLHNIASHISGCGVGTSGGHYVSAVTH